MRKYAHDITMARPLMQPMATNLHSLDAITHCLAYANRLVDLLRCLPPSVCQAPSRASPRAPSPHFPITRCYLSRGYLLASSPTVVSGRSQASRVVAVVWLKPHLDSSRAVAAQIRVTSPRTRRSRSHGPHTLKPYCRAEGVGLGAMCRTRCRTVLCYVVESAKQVGKVR